MVYLSDKIQGFVVFPNCWSVYGSRKVLLNKEVLILSGKKPNRSNVYVKIIFLTSGIRFTYKFVIPYTKRGQKDFLEFLKYWPSSHGLNKLVIKPKCMLIHIYCFGNFLCCVKIGCYNIYIYIFGETRPYA